MCTEGSCSKCHKQKTRCEYPGKPNAGGGLPMKGQPVVLVSSPKCESLEVQCQEVMVQEQANDLAEAHLDVDCDMV